VVHLDGEFVIITGIGLMPSDAPHVAEFMMRITYVDRMSQ
jgi:hypothetical protein